MRQNLFELHLFIETGKRNWQSISVWTSPTCSCIAFLPLFCIALYSIMEDIGAIGKQWIIILTVWAPCLLESNRIDLLVCKETFTSIFFYVLMYFSWPRNPLVFIDTTPYPSATVNLIYVYPSATLFYIQHISSVGIML